MPQAYNNETTERVKRWLATDPLSADRKIQATVVKEWEERWQREVDRSRARHRGRTEEPADELPVKERLKLHEGLQKSGKFPPHSDGNGKDRPTGLLIRTPVSRTDDPSLCLRRRKTARHVE